MKTSVKESMNALKRSGYLGIGLCAIACTIPIIGTIAGIGILSSLAIYFEAAGLIVLLITVGLFAFWYFAGKSAKSSCETSCDTSSKGTCGCSNEEDVKQIQE